MSTEWANLPQMIYNISSAKVYHFFSFLERSRIKVKNIKRSFRVWEDVWLWIFSPSVVPLKLLTRNPVLNEIRRLGWKSQCRVSQAFEMPYRFWNYILVLLFNAIWSVPASGHASSYIGNLVPGRTWLEAVRDASFIPTYGLMDSAILHGPGA